MSDKITKPVYRNGKVASVPVTKSTKLYDIGMRVPTTWLQELRTLQNRVDAGDIPKHLVVAHVERHMRKLPLDKQLKVIDYMLSHILEN